MQKILLVSLIMASLSMAFAETDNVFLIALKKTLPISAADKASMANNAYVYMMAIDAADDNYYEVGKNIILEDDAILQKKLLTKTEALETTDFSNSKEDYKKLDSAKLKQLTAYLYHCQDLNNLACLEDVTKTLPLVNNLILENKQIVTRYEHIVKLSHFNSYSMHITSVLPYNKAF